MQKFLFITNQYSPNIGGGAEVTVQILAETLTARGKNVTVVALSPNFSDSVNVVNDLKVFRVGIENVYVPFGAVRPSRMANLIWHFRDVQNRSMGEKIGAIIDRECPDWVSTHNLGGLSVDVWRAVSMRGIGISHMLHDYYLMCPRAIMYRGERTCTVQCTACRMLSARKKNLSSRVNAVIGISRYILDRHCQAGYFPNAAQAVVLNARPWISRGARAKQRIAGMPLDIGYIGRLEPNKGIEILLQAVLRLPRNTWTLRVAGKSPDAKYLEYLNQHYPNAAIGYLGQVDSATFYPTLDVLVVPSVWQEPLGNVVFEPMGYGVPVIASRAGGIPEVLEGSEAGWLFEPGDVDQLSRHLLRLIENRYDARAMAENAIKRRAFFLPSRQADEFLETIELVYGQRASGMRTVQRGDQ